MIRSFASKHGTVTYNVTRSIRTSFSAQKLRLFSAFQPHQYQYQQYPPPPKTSWGKRFLYLMTGAAAFSVGSYYLWWPRHTFPSPVASILRKGLYAESDKGDKDYKLALKYYIEALEKCDELELDTLSDEYTGVQLKVGEMFERLGMIEDAVNVYTEISGNYLDALTSPDRVNMNLKSHFIQKDLRVIVKLTELKRNDALYCKALLMTHIILAQDEIARKNGNTMGLIVRKENEETPEGVTKTDEAKKEEFEAFIHEKSFDVKNDQYTITTVRNSSAWEPFKDEFFNVLDLYVAICLATGDLSLAVKTKIQSTQWMLAADCNAGDILLSQCNLGSLMYLNAEEYEAKEIALKKDTSDKLDGDMKEQKIQEVSYLKDKCVNLSRDSYQAVLDFSKNIPPAERQDPLITETIALATYGLGVVNLHIGEHNKARSFLREARVRAKGCGYDDLVQEVERELEKLDKEVKFLLGNSKDKLVRNGNIELDIQLHK